MRKPARFLIVGVLPLLMFAAPARADGLAARDWSMKASPSLIQKPPTTEEVRAFVINVIGAQMNPQLCSFAFADFAHDGAYRLVASLDASGRHLCNVVVVIGKQGSQFGVANQWKVWQVDDVSAAMQDFGHDGHAELVLPQNWSPYEGVTHCVATWQTIFQWDNGKFADHSSAFPDFYRTRQKQLKAALDASMGYGSDAVCQQMEIDKIDRVLMVDPRAGFTRAEDWMKGSDSSLKRKAAAVFADINDADSHDDLKKLAEDPNTLVSETAKVYLEGQQ
jgi:hypothetical protein